MQVTTFSCPHCAANLRIRDRMFVGKTVGCPDCGNQLTIVADGAKLFRAEKAAPPETPSKKKRSSGSKRRGRNDAAPSQRREREWMSKFVAKLVSPVGIAWGTAIVAASVMVVFMLSGSGGDRKSGAARADEKSTKADGTTPKQTVVVSPWSSPAADSRGRMLQLAAILAHYEKTRQHLPPGTQPAEAVPPEQQFSWTAQLAALSKEYGVAQPHWNRPWSDPVNERFRTQSIELFRNPKLPATPGADRLPVSHFAGVAGVGADGPNLPVDHPRAGIFGYNRVTRLRDVKDGLENTMMVVGVQNRLSGWAVGGHGTIRSFTKTPYVNGPDGFGTGPPDSMLVLMADGSVREVSRNTEPVIIRRMAAMADGFTLNPKLPGDPGIVKPKTKIGPPPVVGKKKPDPNPPLPRVVRKPAHAKRPRARPPGVKPKVVDVAAALAQPIQRFEQSSPQPFGVLLDELEEIAGVPIRFDKQVVSGKLDTRVALKLEETTVKDILQSLVAKVGLAYKVEAGGLRIVARPPKSKVKE